MDFKPTIELFLTGIIAIALLNVFINGQQTSGVISATSGGLSQLFGTLEKPGG